MKKIIFLGILIFSSFLFAETVKIEEFVVTVFDKSVKVISPDMVKDKFTVVIENRSLVKIIGKIQANSGKVFSIKSIEPNSFDKVFVDYKKGERVFFIPLAPAFQEVELIPGQKTYEIPPRH